uniref:Dynactin subunit 6 n=1 Tax=Caligus clemensi TaxID=344056 RepID=C1BZY8_CALCM|nr:Dynactin subunit 6 [Caligus clemensi]
MNSSTTNTANTSGNLKLAHKAIVCWESELKGDITIGTRTIVHPKAYIWALDGPIIIGDNNIIEEGAKIVNRKDESEGDNTQVMIIGSNNIFEVDSETHALKIGDSNVVEPKAYVGRKTVLTNGCTVGAGVSITTEEILPDNTVLYGSDVKRRIQGDRPAPQHLQIEFLSKVLPNYHHLKKPTKPA